MTDRSKLHSSTPPPGPEVPNRGGRPPALDEYARGKLIMALACGLTQREAAIWVATSQSNVSYLLGKGEFREDLKECTRFARLHPQLRMFQAANQSWRVAARLVERLEVRYGPLTTDELIDGMYAMLEQANAARREGEP